MKKRLFTLLLAACMAFSLLPMQALAAQPASTAIDMQPHAISLDTAELRASDSRPTLNAPEDSIWIEDNEYLCYEDAWDALQVGMIYRRNDVYVNVYLRYTSEETLEDEIYDLAVALAAEALAHRSTSDFNTGDYLAWNVQDLSVELYDGAADETYAYLTLHYMAKYLTTREQEEAMDEELMNLFRNTPLGEHYADGDAMKAVYDYVTQNVTVLGEVTDSVQHSAYGAMINGEASPVGVALLTYYLSYQCGVPCRIISGTVDGYGHVWNIACVDGLYYNLDACMDAGADEYRYFMVCPDNFTDHVRDAEYDTAEFHADHPMAAEDFHLCIHVFDDGVITEEPTCTAEGYKVYTCTGCGKTYGESVPMIDHAYDDGAVTLEPSCDDYGRFTYTCTVCGDSYYELIPMLDHQYDDGQVSIVPTCTEDGSRQYTCTVCGCSYFETVPALGHSYESVVTEGTCTEDGYTTHTCTACGDTYTDGHVSAPGHSYETVTVESTCTEDGSATHTCTACGDTYTEVLPAAGHTHDDGTITREPTCTEVGLMDCMCTTCGEAFVAEIPMIDHNYVDGSCSDCGHLQLLAPAIVSCYSKLQTSVKVTWTPVQNADGYELWRTSTPDDDESWILTKTVKDGAADRYVNQDLTEGLTYYYKVRAYLINEDNAREYSAFSNVDYMPAAVVFDDPYSNATFRIRLRWNEVGGAHGYQIWRQNDDGTTWSLVKTLGDKGNTLTNDQGATTAYSNTGLEAGKTYTYRMRAFMIEDGNKVFGAYSDEYQVAVLPEVPTLTVSSTKSDRATLRWNTVNGASGYQIWIEYPDGTMSIAKSITDGSVTSYTKYDLSYGSTYFFQIRAYVEVNGKKSFGAFGEKVRIDTP